MCCELIANRVGPVRPIANDGAMPPALVVDHVAARHPGVLPHRVQPRYYANRPTLRWDLIGPGRLDHVVATLRAEGFEPFVVVDGGETRRSGGASMTQASKRFAG